MTCRICLGATECCATPPMPELKLTDFWRTPSAFAEVIGAGRLILLLFLLLLSGGETVRVRELSDEALRSYLNDEALPVLALFTFDSCTKCTAVERSFVEAAAAFPDDANVSFVMVQRSAGDKPKAMWFPCVNEAIGCPHGFVRATTPIWLCPILCVCDRQPASRLCWQRRRAATATGIRMEARPHRMGVRLSCQRIGGQPRAATGHRITKRNFLQTCRSAGTCRGCLSGAAAAGRRRLGARGRHDRRARRAGAPIHQGEESGQGQRGAQCAKAWLQAACGKGLFRTGAVGHRCGPSLMRESNGCRSMQCCAHPPVCHSVRRLT